MTNENGRSVAVGEPDATPVARAGLAVAGWYLAAALFSAMGAFSSFAYEGRAGIRAGLLAATASLIGFGILKLRHQAESSGVVPVPGAILSLLGLAVLSLVHILAVAFTTRHYWGIEILSSGWTVKSSSLSAFSGTLAMLFLAAGLFWLVRFMLKGSAPGIVGALGSVAGVALLALLLAPTMEFRSSLREGEGDALYKLGPFALFSASGRPEYALFEVPKSLHEASDLVELPRSVLCPRKVSSRVGLFETQSLSKPEELALLEEAGWQNRLLADDNGLDEHGRKVQRACAERIEALASAGKLPEALLLKSKFAEYIEQNGEQVSPLRTLYFDPAARERISALRGSVRGEAAYEPLSRTEIALLGGKHEQIEREFTRQVEGPLPHERYALFKQGLTRLFAQLPARSRSTVADESAAALQNQISLAVRMGSPELLQSAALRGMGRAEEGLAAYRGGYSDVDYLFANANCDLGYARAIRGAGIEPDGSLAMMLLYQSGQETAHKKRAQWQFPIALLGISPGATQTQCVALAQFYAEAKVGFTAEEVRTMVDIAELTQSDINQSAFKAHTADLPDRNSPRWRERVASYRQPPAGRSLAIAGELLRVHGLGGEQICGYLSHLSWLTVDPETIGQFAAITDAPAAWRGHLGERIYEGLDGCEMTPNWQGWDKDAGTQRGRRKVAAFGAAALNAAGISLCRVYDGGADVADKVSRITVMCKAGERQP